MNSVTEAEKKIIEEFAFFDEWEDKYRLLIEMGRKLPPMAEGDKTDKNKIEGCQSQIWMTNQFETKKDESPRLHFQAQSDSAIVSGLIALLVRLYNNQKTEEIIAHNSEWIEKINLAAHLSPTRRNGLGILINHIFTLARHDKAGRGKAG